MVPLEISLEFRNKIRRGMSTKFGFGQEIKASVEGIEDYFNLTLGDCETVHNPYRNESLEMNKGLSFYSQLMCSQIPIINEIVLKEYVKKELEEAWDRR